MKKYKGIPVLTIKGYEMLLDAGAYVVHLTRALDPIINAEVIRKHFERRRITGGPVIFLTRKNNTITDDIIEAHKELGGQWHFFFQTRTRQQEEERIRKIVPRGMVSSEVIDAALGQHSAR